MDNELQLLHETAVFLQSAGVSAQVVPPQPVGSSGAKNKGYVRAFETIPAVNIFIHGMNYWIVGGNQPEECPIDDKKGLVDLLVKIRKEPPRGRS